MLIMVLLLFHHMFKMSLYICCQDYVSYYKEWGIPQPAIKTLCPIDHTKGRARQHTEDNQSGGDDAVGGAKAPGANGQRDGVARALRGQRMQNMPYARPMNINGRRMLICNVNGVYFQVCL